MTDEQIIKALKCCNDGACGFCPITDSDCIQKCRSEAIELINRQKAEVEEIKDERANLKIILLATQSAGNSYKKEAETLQQALEYQKSLVEILKAEIKKAKSEAIKEFAKRFERNIKDLKATLGQTWEIQNALKETLKEMTEKE